MARETDLDHARQYYELLYMNPDVSAFDTAYKTSEIYKVSNGIGLSFYISVKMVT